MCMHCFWFSLFLEWTKKLTVHAYLNCTSHETHTKYNRNYGLVSFHFLDLGWWSPPIPSTLKTTHLQNSDGQHATKGHSCRCDTQPGRHAIDLVGSRTNHWCLGHQSLDGSAVGHWRHDGGRNYGLQCGIATSGYFGRSGQYKCLVESFLQLGCLAVSDKVCQEIGSAVFGRQSETIQIAAVVSYCIIVG